VTWHSFWAGTETAIGDILKAVFILLPAPFAASIYRSVLSRLKPIDPPNPKKRALRIFKHIVVALFLVLFVTAVGSGCSEGDDDNGYCLYDWKPPTAQESLATFLRFSLLTLSGMAWAAWAHARLANRFAQ
jgi:hypothetical protein